jgi:glycosyltransferase involved in cell wall biosynthesis
METHIPLVTIGVPVYNGERYLSECLESLLGQTFSDFVLVISDNASTDGTSDICRRFEQRDPRVRYLRNERNIGMYPNFNVLLQNVQTKYFKLANADDFWDREMLEKCVAVLESDPSIAVCYPRCTLIDETTGAQTRYLHPLHVVEDDPKVRIRRVLGELRLVNQFQGVARADVLKKILFFEHPQADCIVLVELSLYGKIYELPEFLYYRRLHPDSSSWNRSDTQHQARRLYSEGTDRYRWPAWKYHLALLARVWRAPVPLRDRTELAARIIRGMVWNRRELIHECLQGTLGRGIAAKF